MPDWLESLRNLFDDKQPEIVDEDALARAAAVLLVEIALADDRIAEVEAARIAAALAAHFGGDADGNRQLVEQARELVRDSHSLHRYTHALRTGLGPEQRAALVESLWQVAFADGVLDRHEEHLIRRLADLLGVPHREFIRRKHRAGGG
ncbi:MAG: TerB family tellurite resistance protein [Wenzhouxiangellaceae bacterium]|nr:TerB family tellurite resistance protein [Wenzhouxiangellaceae bacterium]